jgi:hypothetical protein
MLTNDEMQAQEAALRHPVEAMKALRVSTKLGDSHLQEVFMKAYIEMNGGNAESPISQSNVSAAIRDWKIDREITPWLARACVVASRQAAA